MQVLVCMCVSPSFVPPPESLEAVTSSSEPVKCPDLGL